MAYKNDGLRLTNKELKERVVLSTTGGGNEVDISVSRLRVARGAFAQLQMYRLPKMLRRKK